jgi:ornithine carbamoyltransferase
MNAMLTSLYPWSPDSLSREGLLSLLNSASQLERAAEAGTALPQPLRGKRLALLTDDHASPSALAFVRAATEMGAHVAHVRASGAEDGPRRTAALLGKLYDAIECQGLPEAEVRRLGRDAGVPVFDGIGQPGHPLHALAGTLTLEAATANPDLQARQRLRLLQALLSATLA